MRTLLRRLDACGSITIMKASLTILAFLAFALTPSAAGESSPHVSQLLRVGGRAAPRLDERVTGAARDDVDV